MSRYSGTQFLSVPVRLVAHFASNPSSRLTTLQIAELLEADYGKLHIRLKSGVESGAFSKQLACVRKEPPFVSEAVYSIGPALEGFINRGTA